MALSSLLAVQCKMENKKHLGDFGLQLWSVRNAMGKDPIKTLTAVKEIGYADVECAGYNNQGLFYDMDIKTFKKVLSDIGLTMRSSHFNPGINDVKIERSLQKNFEALCEDMAEVGVESIVIPWLPEQLRDVESIKHLASMCNHAGEIANKYNLKLAYHNHDFEFFPENGILPYDVLIENTDSDKLCLELDLYWIKKGGQDYKEYFKKHPGRFNYWHVKDMDDTTERFFTEVGTGVIDWAPIFQSEKEAGMKYFYVEQDDFNKFDPLVSVEMSHDYLRSFEY